MTLETSVGTSDADSITVMGRDLAGELMGKATLTELAFLVVQRRMPSPDEARLLDAVLVSPRGSPIRGRPSRSRGQSPPAFWGRVPSSWASWRTRSASWTPWATTWRAA